MRHPRERVWGQARDGVGRVNVVVVTVVVVFAVVVFAFAIFHFYFVHLIDRETDAFLLFSLSCFLSVILFCFASFLTKAKLIVYA